VSIWWKYIKPYKMKMWVHEAGKQGHHTFQNENVGKGRVAFCHVRKESQNRQKYFLTSRKWLPLSSSGTTDFVGLL
jgi:hypothetical protein